jgi:hypothetical protein
MSVRRQEQRFAVEDSAADGPSRSRPPRRGRGTRSRSHTHAGASSVRACLFDPRVFGAATCRVRSSAMLGSLKPGRSAARVLGAKRFDVSLQRDGERTSRCAAGAVIGQVGPCWLWVGTGESPCCCACAPTRIASADILATTCTQRRRGLLALTSHALQGLPQGRTRRRRVRMSDSADSAIAGERAPLCVLRASGATRARADRRSSGSGSKPALGRMSVRLYRSTLQCNGYQGHQLVVFQPVASMVMPVASFESLEEKTVCGA